MSPGSFAEHEALAALAAELPTDALVVDPDVVDSYRYDRAMTVVPGRPIAVVRAGSTPDVQAVLRIASRYGVPVVTRGAGTGLSGGSVGSPGTELEFAL